GICERWPIVRTINVCRSVVRVAIDARPVVPAAAPSVAVPAAARGCRPGVKDKERNRAYDGTTQCASKFSHGCLPGVWTIFQRRGKYSSGFFKTLPASKAPCAQAHGIEVNVSV